MCKNYKEIISTHKAPKAIGPYSQAIKAGSLLFISGQGAIDPVTQEYQPLGIEEETIMTINNLKSILEEAGSSLDKVLKTTIYLKNMDDFPMVNKIYAEFFQHQPPARSTIEASALPKGFKVEIDAIALISNK